MTRAFSIRTFWFAFFLMASSATIAADHGIYLGGGVVRSSLDSSNDNLFKTAGSRLSDENNRYKIIAGIRPLDAFAIEMNYIDLGKTGVDNTGACCNQSSNELSLKGVDAFAVGLRQIAIVDFYGKAGVIRWQSEDTTTGGVGSLNLHSKDSGFDFAYGAGAQVHFGSFGARLEYERFAVPHTDMASALSLGITWTFL